ncbi:hypothetical protein FACS1894139_06680 [Planctomycetales bacterium]|nr:hypothetical protein FACS1894139_06680 [Planctomycetales bacterium]
MSMTNLNLNDYLAQMYFNPTPAVKTSSVSSALSALSGGAAATVQDAYTGFGSITDSLSLSPASLQNYSDHYLFDKLTSVANEKSNGQYKTLGQVGADLAEELNSFNTFASGLLALTGVTTPVTLQMNGKGGLFQANDTKDSGKVAELLRGEHANKLTSQFALVAARSAILEAAKDPQFTTDYNSNPPGTMEKYEDQLKNLMLSYQLTLDKGSATPSFA